MAEQTQLTAKQTNPRQQETNSWQTKLNTTLNTQHEIPLTNGEKFILKIGNWELLKRECLEQGIFKNGNFDCCNIDQRKEVYIALQ